MRVLPPGGRTLSKIIKGAFLLSAVLYVPVLLEISRLPRWSAPWLPQDSTNRILLAVSAVAAVIGWLAGALLGRGAFFRPRRVYNVPGHKDPIHVLLVSAVLIESGALLGLASSLLLNDARYGLLSVTVTFVLLALHPIEPGGGRKERG